MNTTLFGSKFFFVVQIIVKVNPETSGVYFEKSAQKNCALFKVWFCETRTFLAFVYSDTLRDCFEKLRFCKKSAVSRGIFVYDIFLMKHTFGHMSHKKFNSRFLKSVLFQRFFTCI